MEQYILAERIATAILMENAAQKRSTGADKFYIIVEGVKDFKLFNKYINKSNVAIKEAFGFSKVLDAYKILTERGFENKIGIIDSDFNSILGIDHGIEGVFITDYHDIEVMIINTKALDHVIETFSNPSKISAFEAKNKKAIRETIFELAREIGILKLANKLYDLGLIFKPSTVDGNLIKYRDFIDEKTLTYKGLDNLIDSIINYSRSKSTNLKDRNFIISKYRELYSNLYDLNHLVNGHDLSNIIFILLKKCLNSSNKMLNDYNSIEDSLILAYEYEDFKNTELYKSIRDYESKIGVKILR